MSDLPNEVRVRRQRAHAVASFLCLQYMDGLRVDREALAIAQLYVDGEISVDKMTSAILLREPFALDAGESNV